MSGLSRRIELFSAWSGATRFPSSLPLQYSKQFTRRRFTKWSSRRESRRLPEVRCAACDISLLPTRPAFSVLVHTRHFHPALRILQEPKRQEDVRHTAQPDSSAKPDEQKEGSFKDQGSRSDNNEEKQGQDSGEQEDASEKQKKEDAPPPPPHGDKSPWQVFTDTLRTLSLIHI